MEQDKNLAAERAAAHWNLRDGVRRYGPAYGCFAAAVGHLTVIRDPDLFRRSLVGNWPTMDAFVTDYIVEAGLRSTVEQLPTPVRPYVAIDTARVAAELCEQLLVLNVEQRVWVFDATPVEAPL